MAPSQTEQGVVAGFGALDFFLRMGKPLDDCGWNSFKAVWFLPPTTKARPAIGLCTDPYGKRFRPGGSPDANKGVRPRSSVG